MRVCVVGSSLVTWCCSQLNSGRRGIKMAGWQRSAVCPFVLRTATKWDISRCKVSR